jgi:DNA repair exonuclease SbcCD ATPase subunit
MKNIIVSTGDINRKYEIIGPVYFQVSNKGILTNTFGELSTKYRDEIMNRKKAGLIPRERIDWGFLYGEWSVGQNDFDQAFYVCVREIQKKAERMGGDAVIWMRQDIDLDTDGFSHFYLQMYGTVVKYIDAEIDYHRLAALIDAQYLDRVVKGNPEAAKEIQERKKAIALQQEIFNSKEQAWNEKKQEVRGRVQKIDENISDLKIQLSEIKSVITKLASYGRDNLSGKISEKNSELRELTEARKKLENEKEAVQAELIPYEADFAGAYDKLQNLNKELREYENSL